MESASHLSENRRFAREANYEYYQIPSNADVKSVPISSLSLDVQQKIQRLHSHDDVTNTPSVIVMSPVAKRVFPPGVKQKTLGGDLTSTLSPMVQSFSEQDSLSPSRPNTWSMKEEVDSETCFVPVQTSKKTAETILQLLKTSDEKCSLQDVEKIQPKFNGLNLKVIGIKVNALCMTKNSLYLLPNSRAMASTAETLRTRYPEVTVSHPNAMEGTSNNMDHMGWETEEQISSSETSVHQEDVYTMTGDISSSPPEPQSSRSSNLRSVREESTSAVKLQDETRCEIIDGMTSTMTNTASSPQENDEQDAVTQPRKRTSTTTETSLASKRTRADASQPSVVTAGLSGDPSSAPPFSKPSSAAAETEAVWSSYGTKEAPDSGIYLGQDITGHFSEVTLPRPRFRSGTLLSSYADETAKDEKIQRLKEILKEREQALEALRHPKKQ